MIAAIFVLFGNAGGVGSTVAGVARIPFVVGIDHYMPAAFGKIHPKWKTPWVSMLVQAGISCVILLVTQVNETANSAYLHSCRRRHDPLFHPVPLYLRGGHQALQSPGTAKTNTKAALIPGGKFGVWLWPSGIRGGDRRRSCCRSSRPPKRTHKWIFETKLIAGTAGGVLLGLVLYIRGARAKAREAARAAI